jgi:hypothetical protein
MELEAHEKALQVDRRYRGELCHVCMPRLVHCTCAGWGVWRLQHAPYRVLLGAGKRSLIQPWRCMSRLRWCW